MLVAKLLLILRVLESSLVRPINRVVASELVEMLLIPVRVY